MALYDYHLSIPKLLSSQKRSQMIIQSFKITSLGKHKTEISIYK
ncbi:hypothetical protein FDUTEX481_03918 [Tolypothrix sp. PCC 7601]|nr:hypothetical protein FDUTEX481_03918 [Tolypothrix sp. PCC 7601]